MKVQVDKQGWELLAESGGWKTFEGAAAVDTTAEASTPAAGTVVPGSGVFAKVTGSEATPTDVEELSSMDTIPAPSSDELATVIPRPASVPPDLAALAATTDRDATDDDDA